jgi:hypothetical protein
LFALQAYDQHLNMILGDVEETVTSVEIDEETFEEIIKVRRVEWNERREKALCGAGWGASWGEVQQVGVHVTEVFVAAETVASS